MGSKNVVLKFRSVNNIVTAPPNTGKDKRSNIVVINIDQTKRGRRSIVTIGERIFIIVPIKFIEAKIDEAPAQCKEKIAKSTEAPT